MTEGKNTSLITVLMWAVVLAVAADIAIIVNHHKTVLEMPDSQTPVATVTNIAATPMPSTPAPIPTVTSYEPPPETQPSDLIPAAPMTNNASNEPLQ